MHLTTMHSTNHNAFNHNAFYTVMYSIPPHSVCHTTQCMPQCIPYPKHNVCLNIFRNAWPIPYHSQYPPQNTPHYTIHHTINAQEAHIMAMTVLHSSRQPNTVYIQSNNRPHHTHNQITGLTVHNQPTEHITHCQCASSHYHNNLLHSILCRTTTSSTNHNTQQNRQQDNHPHPIPNYHHITICTDLYPHIT